MPFSFRMIKNFEESFVVHTVSLLFSNRLVEQSFEHLDVLLIPHVQEHRLLLTEQDLRAIHVLLSFERDSPWYYSAPNRDDTRTTSMRISHTSSHI